MKPRFGTIRTRAGLLGTAALVGLLVAGCTTSTPAASTVTSQITTTVTDTPTAGTSTGTSSTTASATTTLPPQRQPAFAVPPSRITDAVGKLDGIVNEVMQESGVPGMAVAVVYQGKVLYAKGFGVRKVGAPDKVDPDTVFQLASLSKSIGATVVAHEVTTKTVSWTTPVQKNLPSFALSDPYVTSHVTIGDLYAHRSGLPEHAGDVLEDLGYTQAQIFQRLQALPLKPFRSTYAYTNFGLTAAAESVAAAAKTDWDTLSENVLYKPLGMTSTSSKFSDYAAAKDRAWTHVRVNGQWVAQVVRDPDQQTPAGGVSSTVNDLAKWMIMLLGNGTAADGTQIAAPAALDPAITPQVFTGPAASPSSRPGYYGFGFNVSNQSSGRVQISHSGAFNAGAGTNFVLSPLAGLGIVTLTNGSPFGAAETVGQMFNDLAIYGSPQQNWWKIYNDALEGLAGPMGSLAGKQRPADARPPAALTKYAGTYSNAYVGTAVVSVQGSSLVMQLGPKGAKFPLTPWDSDVFTYVPTGEMANAGSISKVSFSPTVAGPSKKVTIEWFDDDGQGTLLRRS
jgi:CubicO group peptidase (beta-lactamase class C family)